jgi:hypothetical protein
VKNTFKVFFVLSSILTLGFTLSSSSQASNYNIGPQVLDGGGAMWLTTTSYKLSSSLGQSITGEQIGTTRKVYSGFWNPRVVEMSPVEQEEEDLSQLPREFDMQQNYPNPFNPNTLIEYTLPKSTPVKIQVFNILGQDVRVLVDESQEPGYKTVYWDGKDNSGREVGSGIYFYRIVAGSFVKCKKMALLK